MKRVVKDKSVHKLAATAKAESDKLVLRMMHEFMDAHGALQEIWQSVSARYEFRGSLARMNLRVQLGSNEIVIHVDVPDRTDPEAQNIITLEVTEPILADDTDLDEVVHRCIHQIMAHEADEGFFVSGKAFRNAHANDKQPAEESHDEG